MISVAYEVTSLALSRFGGIATTCYHTLAQAATHDSFSPTALYRRGQPPDSSPVTDWQRTHTWHAWQTPRYDLVHALCHRLPPTRAHRRVYTLHDAWSLTPNRYQPEDFQKKLAARLRKELPAVDLVVTGSEAGRNALLAADVVAPEKVLVAYQGATPIQQQPDRPPSRLLAPLLDVPFVLFVGRLETRKNIPHILAALHPLDSVHLVLVGEPGFGFRPEIEDVLAHFPPSRLHQFSLIAEPDLAALYRHALAALQPSWEEGFGLPILEAMSHGCPVITSNCSAPPEIVGNAGFLVDPTDPKQSREALERLLDDQFYRRELSEAGHERAAGFTWERYYATLVEAYQTLL